MGSMDFSRVKRVSCALTTILVAAQALAAPAPSIVPGSARPDMVERRNDSENLRPAVGGAALISMPKHAGKSIAGKAEFVLKGVTLDGATVFTPEEMQALYQEKIDQKISLDALSGIADDITAYYRNHGYILTRAVVPPQRAEGA